MSQAISTENFQSQLNTLITKTVEAEWKTEEGQNFFLNDNASQELISNGEKEIKKKSVKEN